MSVMCKEINISGIYKMLQLLLTQFTVFFFIAFVTSRSQSSLEPNSDYAKTITDYLFQIQITIYYLFKDKNKVQFSQITIATETPETFSLPQYRHIVKNTAPH